MGGGIVPILPIRGGYGGWRTLHLQYDYSVPYADPALREVLPDFQTMYILLLICWR